jgi:MYXO-CTERM domain-containing protein
MPVSSSWRWSALTIALGLFGSMAHAEMITPDSIANPPSAVTPTGLLSANNIINNQYDGLGLRFFHAAITQLNNIPVWQGTDFPYQQTINYQGLGFTFVRPGSLVPATVSTFTLDLIGVTGTPNVVINSLYGRQLFYVPVLQSTPGPDGGQLWTVTGPGIYTFGVGASGAQGGPWGVSGISFTPTPAPEPSSLVLAGLGALGFVALLGRRRERRSRGNEVCMA